MTLIGATTENPYFEVNSALLSPPPDLRAARARARAGRASCCARALADPERGIADPPPIADDALELLAERSGGDARTALGGARAGGRGGARRRAAEIDLATAEDALQRKAVSFDKRRRPATTTTPRR